MPGLTPSQVQGSPFLRRFIVRHPEEQGAIVRLIAPAMEVEAESGSFWVIQFDYGKRLQQVGRGVDGKVPRSRPPLAAGTYTTKNYSHGTDLADRVRDNAMRSPDGFKRIVPLYQQNPAMVVVLNWEQDLATLMTTAGTYFSANHYTTLTGTDQWSDFTNSDPLDDVVTIGEVIEGNSGLKMEQLTAVVGRQVFHKLRQHPAVKENVINVQKANVEDLGPANIASFFGVKDCIVAGALKVTSNIGASSETVARIWGKNFFLVNVDPSPNAEAGTSGSFVTATTSGLNIPVPSSYRNDELKATIFESEMQAGVTKGAKTGEGVRTAGAIFAAIA